MRLSPLHAFRLPSRTHQKFFLRINELYVIGGESGIGSPSIQPLQPVAESLLGRFPFNVSPIIDPRLARLPAPAVPSTSLPKAPPDSANGLDS